MRTLTICLLLAISCATLASANKVVCYWGSWSHYRNGNGKVTVDDLNPTLCTHMIYSFVGVTSNAQVAILDAWLDIDLKGFEKFVGMKSRNPNLKLLIAIGGWNQGGAVFSQVVGNPSSRAQFVQNLLQFVKQYRFDGLDLDWEYPNGNGGQPQDKQTFIELLKELRPLFDANNLLLTAAVGATKKHMDASYDVPSMNRYLDFINIMAYDLHGSWETQTGQNAALYGSSADPTDFNVAAIMPQWINAGADPRKLILGLGFYGRSFTLANANNNQLGAPTIGGGAAGPFTAESGTLSYLEICTNLRSNGWTEVYDNQQQVPYSFKGNQWIGYDNVQSLQKKVDYAKSLNLGGVMVWSLEQDDIRNVCGGGDWPLLRAVNNRLGGGGGDGGGGTNPTNPPAVTTTKAPTVGGKPNCNANGIVADPTTCEYFYVCDSGVGTRFQCGAGTLFDKSIGSCNHAHLVHC